jgi:hypothetical protein
MVPNSETLWASVEMAIITPAADASLEFSAEKIETI